MTHLTDKQIRTQKERSTRAQNLANTKIFDSSYALGLSHNYLKRIPSKQELKTLETKTLTDLEARLLQIKARFASSVSRMKTHKPSYEKLDASLVRDEVKNTLRHKTGAENFGLQACGSLKDANRLAEFNKSLRSYDGVNDQENVKRY